MNSLAEPYISLEGNVYTTDHILHLTSDDCTHRSHNFCADCDVDGAIRERYLDVCPW